MPYMRLPMAEGSTELTNHNINLRLLNRIQFIKNELQKRRKGHKSLRLFHINMLNRSTLFFLQKFII